MAYTLTDSLKHNRFSVVAVDPPARRLRVRSESEMCTDLTCDGTVVLTEGGKTDDLSQINPGDIITIEQKDGRASEIRVVRRVYDEYSSPEW
ncbi:MAG TPA: hypothetical protein VFN71_11315 [Methylomirabilota bacterium]|nr:hypothetical protein [Methylomirabilota bacterium]